jgi:hypothetical protein
MKISCPECIRLLDAWTEATHELCRSADALLGIAISGELLRYNVQADIAEAARLRLDNARTALELHQACHQSEAPELFAPDAHGTLTRQTECAE